MEPLSAVWVRPRPPISQFGLVNFSFPPPPAASYDSINHCVWTTNDDSVDVWDCSGKSRPAVHLLAGRLGKPSTQDLIPDTDGTRNTVQGADTEWLDSIISGDVPVIISLGGDQAAPEAHWDRVVSAGPRGGVEGCGLPQPPAVLSAAVM